MFCMDFFEYIFEVSVFGKNSKFIWFLDIDCMWLIVWWFDSVC